MAVVQANSLLEDQIHIESGSLSLLGSGLYDTFVGVYSGQKLCILVGTKERNSDSDNSDVVRDGTCYDNEFSVSAVVAVENGSSEHSATEISSLRENGNAEKMKHWPAPSALTGGFAAAFRDQIHTDIEVKPGHNRPSLFAHRALLAARSEIFKNMLDSD
ncbi:BTB/POZ domain-containing protein At3g56230-like [Vitis riparia]|uniref:BTB/POZ domain-containing protein At3g56230-like n=1 Tax=Vitis riparia TaxID=96939 RepID=UPI00155B16E9|nr:BTB/POZ domain-containing protein At3g56230-like [Vitis riparia]